MKKVRKITLSTVIDPDLTVGAKIITAYGEDKHVLGYLVFTKYLWNAEHVYRNLITELTTYGDQAFWDLWDYEFMHQKQLKKQQITP